MGSFIVIHKILDYTKPLSRISTKIHEKVLWPCFEHSVSITGLPSFSGNIFEELILKLLFVSDIKSPDQLSFDTGLEIDFVTFILDRLIQKNLLNEDLSLTEDGITKLKEETTPNPQMYCVYTDAISGKLISTIDLSEERKYLFYSEGNIDYTDYDNEGNIKPRKFYYSQINSTAGNESLDQRPMYVFRQKFEADQINIPEVDDIIRILKKTHTIIDNENGLNIIIDKSRPKFVYRVIDIVLQEGNTRDFFSSDGKGNLSPFYTNILNNYLDSKDEIAISLLRDRLEKNILNKEKLSDHQKENLDPVKFRINKKSESIEKARKTLEKYENNEIIQNTDSEKELSQIKVNLIFDIYSFIEWIFYYKCTHGDIPITVGIDKLKSIIGNNNHNQLLIQRYLLRKNKDLGFSIVKENESFFFVKIGRINHSIDESPELFAISAIATALSDGNQSYWFSKLGNLYPDFFNKICDFKRLRDEAIHQNDTSHTSKEILDFYEYIKKIFGELLKNIEERSSISELEENLTHQNEVNKSIQQMEQDLGFALKNALPDKLFTIFENIERYTLSDSNVNLAVVISMDQFFESCFEILKANLSKSKGDYREKYKAVWHRDGSSVFDIIKENKIDKEVSGRAVSLQAALIAWISMEDINILYDFGREFPNLLEDIHNIACMRVHGEVPDYDRVLSVHQINGTTLDYNEKIVKATKILLQYKSFCIKFIKFLAENGYFEK